MSTIPHTRRLSIFSLALCFVFAAIAEAFFGVAAITGSFLAGMMIANMKESHYVERRIDMSTYMMFSPLFFANIGISLNYDQIGQMFTSSSVVFILLFCLELLSYSVWRQSLSDADWAQKRANIVGKKVARWA